MKNRRALAMYGVLGLMFTGLSFFSLALVVRAAGPDFDYYKGKTMNYIVSTKPGGGYDAYARLIGKYIPKYIPGLTLVIKNVPGAGHIIGANETYLAKPDGLTIGTFNTGLIYSQIIGMEGIRFDLAQYNWVGKASSEQRVLFVNKGSRFKSLKDLIESKEPIKMGASGVGSAAYLENLILSSAMGINLKPIPGYQGKEGEMAMLRGEVVGQIAAYNSVRPFIKAENCPVLLQVGAKKHPELLDVPLALDLKLSPKGKKLIDLMTATIELGRLTGAPPKTRPERLAALIEGYRKAINDPELLKEGEKIGLDFDPAFGEEVAKLVKEAVQQPEENVAFMKAIMKTQ